MPVLYENLTYNDILHHQAAYECFDRAGKEMFEDWDIIGFEKAILGCRDDHYLYMAEQIKKTHDLYGELDEKMPFLKFRENGPHYAYELFLSPPKFWGSRGAPLYWAYVARMFTYDKLPMAEDLLYEKYLSIAKSFGINIRYQESCYIERFAAGGMSSGIVTSEFVRKGWQTIRNRNRRYFTETKPGNIIYLDRAKERISWYCNNYMPERYDVLEEIKEDDFMFAVMDSGCNQNQKDTSFLLWGINTGKPLKVKEVAEMKGVTDSCVRQLERRFLHHLLSNKNANLLIRETGKKEN